MENSEIRNSFTSIIDLDQPFFRVVKTIPSGFTKDIEEAVRDFIATSHVPDGVDKQGFYLQTLEAIANATYLGGGGEFWMGTAQGNLVVYILAHVSKDIDNRLSYTVSQAWVRKDFRTKPIVKKWWESIRQRAKDLFCGHLMIISSRGVGSYERFLGHGMKLYANMLKETL